MPMIIESKKDFTMAEIDAAKKVSMYLSGAVRTMGATSSKKEADRAADAYLKKNPVAVDDKKAALKVIDNLNAHYQKEAKQADFKTKAEYVLGGKEGVKAVMLGAASVVTGIMASHGMDPMAAVSFTLFAGALSTAGYAATADAEKNKSDALKAYTEAKHAQIALKKLKNVLDPKPSYKDQVKGLMASGLGNPGGMISPLNFKKQNGGR